MREVRVTNMTSLFNKEMLMYSFFDIRLQAPVKVTAIFYFILLFVTLSVPILFIFKINVYSVAAAIGIPAAGSTYMSKPIWNGKTLRSYIKTQMKYFGRPKALYDWKYRDENTNYKVNSTILVSRHEDFNKLYKEVVKEEGL